MDFEKLATRYRGPLAQEYDRRRKRGAQWLAEQEAVDALLARFPAASTVLDIPAGTGRFIELYKKYGLRASGMDSSADMLAEAARKAREIGLDIDLRTADIRKIAADDGSFDSVLCMRFLNWVDPDGLKIVLAELARVAKSHLILGIRCAVDGADIEPRRISAWRRFLERRKLRRQQKKGARRYRHRDCDVHDLFAGLGLKVKAAKVLERRSDNTEYRIYLLTRERHA
jgi:ubiquinone/menaquinone biosynthesis C-methylase UbiE